MSRIESPLYERLINAFLRIARAVHLYADNNQAVVQACSEFRKILFQDMDEEPLSIQLSEGHIYFKGERLRIGSRAAATAERLEEYLTGRGIYGIVWQPEAQEIPAEEIVAFFRILAQASEHDNPLIWVRQCLAEKSISWVMVESKQDLKASLPGIPIGEDKTASESGKGGKSPASNRAKLWERGRQSYGRTLSILKSIADKIMADKPAGVAKAMRQIQQIVDMIIADDEIMIGLSTLRDHDDYTYVHSMNVSILAITMGHFIGLSKRDLATLGLCGLFHDLGKIKVPLEILNKPGKLDAAEWKVMQRHSLESVLEILKLKAPPELKARLLLPPFEHHLKYDLSGYPKFHRRQHVSLFGRILAIVDVYDAITSPRVYRKTSLSPDEALDLMTTGAGKDFDPLLLKAFVNLMGVYPVGTLVRMDSGEIGLVARRPQGKYLDRPQVRILLSNGNGGFIPGRTIDLAEKNGHAGSFRRSVVETIHPGQLGIQPAAYLC